jgi:hypothetical protein
MLNEKENGLLVVSWIGFLWIFNFILVVDEVDWITAMTVTYSDDDESIGVW